MDAFAKTFHNLTETLEQNEDNRDAGSVLKPEHQRQHSSRSEIALKALNVVNHHDCVECGNSYSSKHSRLKHLRRKHEGIKYPCNRCDFQATLQQNLMTHKRSKHEGIKY